MTLRSLCIILSLFFLVLFYRDNLLQVWRHRWAMYGMIYPTPPLFHLPPELLLSIADFLPPDAILALKLTHPLLNTTLPALPRLKTRPLSRCARYAIERHRTPPDGTPQRARCILCKTVYPTSMFASSSSPACLPRAFDADKPRPEVVELPRNFCAWHVGRLARIVRTGPGGRNGWVSDVKRMCMHNGCIRGWDECDCGCSSCGYRMVRTYTRFLNNDVECKRFYFWRDAAKGASLDPGGKVGGRLFVQEVCRRTGAAPGNVAIQLPVQYQDVVGSNEISRDSTCTKTTITVSDNLDHYTPAGKLHNITTQTSVVMDP